VVGISHQLKIPIKFIGIGETMDDLRPFDASDFVEAIFGYSAGLENTNT
jgi:fused signal recognition particle receptor